MNGVAFSKLSMLAVLLLLLSCRGSAPPPPTGPVLSEAQIQATWPWQGAFGTDIDEDVFSGVVARWLGGVKVPWKRPGASYEGLHKAKPSAGLRQLHLRGLEEDRLALGHLGAVLAHSSCRLAAIPDAFGPELADAYLLGVAACKSLGNEDGAKAALANAGLSGDEKTLDPTAGPQRSTALEGADQLAALLVPEVKVLEVRGEQLEYVLLRPAQVDAARELLGLWAQEASSGEMGQAGATGSFVLAAATSGWSGSSSLASTLLPSAKSILESAPAGPGRLAQVEALLEDGITVWQRGLRALPREGDAALDAGGRALLERWFRRALYRDVGLLALDEGDADLALLCLEEAAEARGRVRPGAGLDPLLLTALARARYECNELQRAVELLDDIASVTGWELAAPAARTIARVAVVGSGADAKVNR